MFTEQNLQRKINIKKEKASLLLEAWKSHDFPSQWKPLLTKLYDHEFSIIYHIVNPF